MCDVKCDVKCEVERLTIEESRIKNQESRWFKISDCRIPALGRRARIAAPMLKLWCKRTYGVVMPSFHLRLRRIRLRRRSTADKCERGRRGEFASGLPTRLGNRAFIFHLLAY